MLEILIHIWRIFLERVIGRVAVLPGWSERSTARRACCLITWRFRMRRMITLCGAVLWRRGEWVCCPALAGFFYGIMAYDCMRVCGARCGDGFLVGCPKNICSLMSEFSRRV